MGEVMKGCWEIQDEVVALATTLQQDSQPRMDLPSLCVDISILAISLDEPAPLAFRDWLLSLQALVWN